jgi:hypothetical protein
MNSMKPFCRNLLARITAALAVSDAAPAMAVVPVRPRRRDRRAFR